MESINPINQYQGMLSQNQATLMPRRRRPQKKKPDSRPGTRSSALIRLAHDTHQLLVEKGSPLRLCIYEDEKDLFMEVITMDKTQKINHSFTRPIRENRTKNLIKKIHNQMGLVVDYSV